MAATASSSMAKQIRAVVLDIEGTTTSISFVADVLFPYIRRNLASYLNSHWGDEDLRHVVKNLASLGADLKTTEAHKDVPLIEDDAKVESVISLVSYLMDRDLKVTPLKALQGQMWVSGYSSGELVGHLYDDVVPSLKRWNGEGEGEDEGEGEGETVPVYIYSSGSIAAQKLLFGHTSHGDILHRLRGHFDTTTGSKVERGSYSTIANDVIEGEGGDKESLCLFVTDAILEAEAAKEAGMNVVISERPGNKALPSDVHTHLDVVTSFEELFGARFQYRFEGDR
eukprot:TRINITY_DN255_c0_g1_i1.p1 TRINITY_DN255_c0_g1~~TRINITY_DN255_c0_g1_i1.p1  ORF type:complete len:283 (+),score=89.86 TRINITY_DN255_c0_g1_i1:1113-1961(+)